MIKNAETWLESEDKMERAARIERLTWIAKNKPNVRLAFHGSIPADLVDEAQYCFVYGQYLASIVLSLVFLEQTLAGVFCAIGRNDLERASLLNLAEEAKGLGWISDDEFQALSRAWDLLKPVTHFRPPGHPERIGARQSREATPRIYDVIEKDVRLVLQSLFHLMLRIAAGSSRNLSPRQ